jgi:hypothetical protein
MTPKVLSLEELTVDAEDTVSGYVTYFTVFICSLGFIMLNDTQNVCEISYMF